VPLKAVDQVIIPDGDIDCAALGAAEASEDVGELRYKMDMAAFTDDTSVNGAFEAPVAIDSDMYRDYYNMFGMLLVLHLMGIF
jgi:hypothetical protein